MRLAAVLALSVTTASLVAQPAAAGPPTCFGRAATIVGGRAKKVVGTPAGDVIVAGRRTMTIESGAGRDRICFSSTLTDADAGRGNDLVRGTGTEWRSGKRAEVLGGPGDDRLFSEWQHLRGGAGDDLLAGGMVSGEAGDDVFRPIAYESTTVTYMGSPRPVVADLGAGTIDGQGHDRLEAGDFGVVIGSRHDDLLVAGSGMVTLVGGQGADEIVGSKGHDRIYGDTRHSNAPGGGADTITGGGTFDVVFGGGADDVVRAGPGEDLVFGNAGNDVIYGGPGDDELEEGRRDRGDDRVIGGGGVDFISYVDTGRPLSIDLAAGTATGAGEDLLEGIENVVGGEARDAIRGDEGPNRLLGSSSRDTLEGRAGDDRLDGGGGIDVLDGGEGNDVCETDGDPDVTIGCESDEPPPSRVSGATNAGSSPASTSAGPCRSGAQFPRASARTSRSPAATPCSRDRRGPRSS